MSVNHQFTPRGGSTDLAAYSLNGLHHQHHQHHHELNHKKITGRGQSKEFHQSDLNVILESNHHQFNSIHHPDHQLQSQDFNQFLNDNNNDNNNIARSNLGPILPPILPYHINTPLSNHTTTTTTKTFINSSDSDSISNQIRIDKRNINSENYNTSFYPRIYSTNHQHQHRNPSHQNITYSEINSDSNPNPNLLSQNTLKCNSKIPNLSRNDLTKSNQNQKRYNEIKKSLPINFSSSSASSSSSSNQISHQSNFEEIQFYQRPLNKQQLIDNHHHHHHNHNNDHHHKINLNEKYQLNLNRNYHSNQIPDKKHKCEFCSQAFARRHDRDRHERMHTGEKPYVCQECSKGFMRSDALNRHHSIEPKCGKRFE
ncbi:hypothetical protein DFH28DRAFT_1123881 [Melampsora americana]|nr:hypothetical protein DFH28DRAFT_1123881 [Melampsora americana]